MRGFPGGQTQIEKSVGSSGIYLFSSYRRGDYKSDYATEKSPGLYVPRLLVTGVSGQGRCLQKAVGLFFRGEKVVLASVLGEEGQVRRHSRCEQ